MANKRNVVMEIISVLFMAPRSDCLHLRRCTSEMNEHIFGMLRQILCKFTVEGLVCLGDKLDTKTESIFKGDLATSQTNMSGQGY